MITNVQNLITKILCHLFVLIDKRFNLYNRFSMMGYHRKKKTWHNDLALISALFCCFFFTSTFLFFVSFFTISSSFYSVALVINTLPEMSFFRAPSLAFGVYLRIARHYFLIWSVFSHNMSITKLCKFLIINLRISWFNVARTIKYYIDYYRILSYRIALLGKKFVLFFFSGCRFLAKSIFFSLSWLSVGKISFFGKITRSLKYM